MEIQDAASVPREKPGNALLVRKRAKKTVEEKRGEEDGLRHVLGKLPDDLVKLPTLVPKLVAESSLDRVGGAGGLRVYIPARMAKDRQFPFKPGELTRIRVMLDPHGREGGLLLAKKPFMDEFEASLERWTHGLPAILNETFDRVNYDSALERITAYTRLSAQHVAVRLLSFILGVPDRELSIMSQG